MSNKDKIPFYNIKQASDEKKEKYQLGDYVDQPIQYQIHQTSIIRIV